MNIPFVIERTAAGERSYDLMSRLLEDRIVKVDGPVEGNMAAIVTAELLYLNSLSKTDPIYMYINSPGGHVIDGLSIIDTMNFISAPVYTIVNGMAASMGAAILSCGEPGHRYALPNAQIMLHEVSGGEQGKIRDTLVENNYTRRLNNLLLGMIAYNCGKISKECYELIREKVEKMKDDVEDSSLHLPTKMAAEFRRFKKETNIDMWLMPTAAKNYGIIDDVLRKEF